MRLSDASLAGALLLVFAGLSNLVRADCNVPNLPTDLDLITSVEATGYREVHLQGAYRLGNDRYIYKERGQVHNLTLQYTTDHEFRLSLLAPDADSMKIYLWDDGQGKLVTSSLHGSRTVEHMIFAVLKANVHYTVEIVYNMAWIKVSACPTVTMELAVQPRELAVNLDSSICDGQPSVPDLPNPITATEASGWYYDFDSSASTYPYAPIGYGASGSDSDSTDGLSSGGKEFFILGPRDGTEIAVPHIPGRHQQWKFRLVINANFLDGGDIVALLVPNRSKFPEQVENCAGCVYGQRGIRNSFILETILWAGQNGEDGIYTLWFLLRKPEPSLTRSCAPYAVEIDLHPLKDRETFINCGVDPLPPTFNVPGYYNNASGTMSYTADVLVNLSLREQRVTITPTKSKSLLRTWISDHKDLDVDLSLFRGKGTGDYLAASLSMDGPEGIIYELQGGVTYTLVINVPFAHRDSNELSNDYYVFCDSIQLHAHVFPLDSLGSDSDSPDSPSSCRTIKPNMDGIQARLNASGYYTFAPTLTEMYPFAYHIDPNSDFEQKEIARYSFFFKRESVFDVIVPSDNYGGRVQMQLWADANPATKLYSTQRGLGSNLFAEVSPGWYTLVLLTPYTQISSRKFKDVVPDAPTCVRYSYIMTIEPSKGDEHAAACVYPIDIPHDLHIGAHPHTHFTETFRIPMDGTAGMSVAPTVDSILHLLVVETTAPVSMYLTRGDVANADEDSAVAQSYDVLDDNQPSLLYLIKGGEQFTVTFSFSMEDATDVDCQSMVLMLSLSPPPAQSDCNAMHRRPQASLIVLDRSTGIGPWMLAMAPPQASEDTSDVITEIFLEVLQPTNLRIGLNYRFEDHQFSGLLCSCDSDFNCEDDCLSSIPDITGWDLTANLLQPGNYSLLLYSWDNGLGHGRTDYTRWCTYVSFQMAVEVVSAKPAVATCSAAQQYLPATFNHPGGLYSLYHSEVHFQAYVRVPQQTLHDDVSFDLTRRSIFRAYVPYSGVIAMITLEKAHAGDGETIASATGAQATIYELLEPGRYIFSIRYYLSEAQNSATVCSSLPLELSVIEAASLPKLVPSEKTGSCTSDPLPSTPHHHGHQTLFRPTGQPFKWTLAFPISASGGKIDLDVRYPFEVAGLAVTLTGDEISGSGEKQNVRHVMRYYGDRAFYSQPLPTGQYVLAVWDPVGRFAKDTTMSCTAWSLHLDVSDFGNRTTAVPGQPPVPAADSSSSSSSSGGFAVPPPPQLRCPDESLDVPPTQNLNSAKRLKFVWKSPAAAIPYDQQVSAQREIRGTTVRYLKTTVSLGFFVDDSVYIRAWVRTADNTFVTLTLYSANSTTPLRTGQTFGFHTATLVHRPASISMARLEIEFRYNQQPGFHVTYDTCEQKLAQTSYEVFVAVIPESDVAALTACPTSASAPHHPQPELKLGEPVLSSDEYYFSQADFILPTRRPMPLPPGGSPAGPPRNGNGYPSTGPPNDGTGNGPERYLVDRITSSENVTLTIPAGTRGARVYVNLLYNLYVSNFRLVLYGANQSLALSQSVGRPRVSNDETYNGVASLRATGLGPGTYFLIIAEANAEHELAAAAYCIRYQLGIIFLADVYSAATPSPLVGTPTIFAIQPPSSQWVDPTGSFRITAQLSEDAVEAIQTPTIGDKTLVTLVSGSGERISPAIEYFVNAKEVISVFAANALSWDTQYTLSLNRNVILPAARGKPYQVSAPLPTYHTGYCACTAEGTCAKGGGCRCTLASGMQCTACEDGSRLSRAPVALGETGAQYFVCQADAVTAAPRTPVPVPTNVVVKPTSVHTTKKYNDGWGSSSSSGWDHNGGPDPYAPHSYSPLTLAPGATLSPSAPEKPPLKALRVILSSAVVVALFTYSAMMWLQFNRSRSRRPNPFRRLATRPTDEDDNDENDAIVH